MYVCVFMLVMSCKVSLQTYTSNSDDVKVLPFVTLYREQKSLHLVKDYYRLIQTINVEPIANHINYIANGFASVRKAYKGHTNPLMFDIRNMEA